LFLVEDETKIAYMLSDRNEDEILFQKYTISSFQYHVYVTRFTHLDKIKKLFIVPILE